MTEDEYSRIEGGAVVGKAIQFMRAMPRNKDGSMGHVCQRGTPEWDAWQAYFERTGKRRQASFMRQCWANGYTVPCRDPAHFDLEFRHEWVRPAKIEKPLTPRQREEIAQTIQRAFPPVNKRSQVGDPRDNKAKEPETRALTEREAESMRRLMGMPQQKDAAE